MGERGDDRIRSLTQDKLNNLGYGCHTTYVDFVFGMITTVLCLFPLLNPFACNVSNS